MTCSPDPGQWIVGAILVVALLYVAYESHLDVSRRKRGRGSRP